MDIKVGDWVRYTWNEKVFSYATNGYREVRKYAFAKVAALGTDDEPRLTLESWEIAKFHHNRRVAFGNKIDRSPYREGGIFYWDADAVTVMTPAMARFRDAELAKVMRYPTRSERDNARRKRNAARKAGVR